MQVDSPQKIRNVAVTGHNDTGKTMLASALLYTSGITTRLTKVDDGNAVTDFDPEEIERKISINLSAASAPWRGHKVNLLDCPGYGIFFTDARAGMRTADLTLLCVNGVSGPEVNTDRVWHFAEEIERPVVFHLTKMDRERADFDRTTAQLEERFGRKVVPIHLPIGSETEFTGVIDLVTGKAYEFSVDDDGKGKEIDVPAELAGRVDELRETLVEAVAETRNELMEAFFEEGTLTDEELLKGLRRAIRRRQIYPVTVGSHLHGVGNSTLLDAIVNFFPSPDECPFPAERDDSKTNVNADPEKPASAIVFKTMSDPFSGKISLVRVVSGQLDSEHPTWNSRLDAIGKVGQLMEVQGKTGKGLTELIAGDIGGVAKLKDTATGDTLASPSRRLKLAWITIPPASMSFAIEPKSKGDEEKIGEALTRLIEEDPTLTAGRDAETHEYLLSGRDQLHIEIAVSKLKNRYHVEVVLHPPKVPYRETIRRAADGIGRHKKQSGGRGQFAHCEIKMEPLPSGGDFEFSDEIFGGSIPQTYRPAVEKGIQEARNRGYLAGYPVVDFRVRLLDGKFHDVDSSEMAFKIAGSLAFKDAMESAGPTLLEPYMQVEITIPEEIMGDVMGDLSQRRGRPQGMEAANESQVIKATVPMAEMLDYATSLRSMSQGRASFQMEFSHYEEVPKQIREKIIAEAKGKEAEADG